MELWMSICATVLSVCFWRRPWENRALEEIRVRTLISHKRTVAQQLWPYWNFLSHLSVGDRQVFENDLCSFQNETWWWNCWELCVFVRCIRQNHVVRFFIQAWLTIPWGVSEVWASAKKSNWKMFSDANHFKHNASFFCGTLKSTDSIDTCAISTEKVSYSVLIWTEAHASSFLRAELSRVATVWYGHYQLWRWWKSRMKRCWGANFAHSSLFCGK